MASEKETAEVKETKEKVTAKFGEFEVTANEKGDHFKGKQEIVEDYFKTQGITKDVTKKVFGAVHDLHMKMIDFCGDKVCENKMPTSLELPVISGLSLTSKVNMRKQYPGVARKDADGNIIPPVPSTVYGGIKIGMDFSIGKPFEAKVEEISTKVKSACEDFCNKRDKEKEAEAAAAAKTAVP